MEIRITSGLPPKEAHDIEMAQLQRARTASSFSLRLNAEGKLDKHAFSQLLTAARASNAYKANQQHYQFKLKSDNSGHYLTLKQQGLWSRFKGVFGWGRETRERQRADAGYLIRGYSVSKINQARQQGQITDGMSFSDAKADQRTIMDVMGPKRHRQAGSQSSSEAPDFEKLMGGTRMQSEEQDAHITQHHLSDRQNSQSENRQSDYRRHGAPQNSLIRAQNDDDDIEGQDSSKQAGLFQQYLHMSDDEIQQQDEVSDRARPSLESQHLARLIKE